MENQQKKMLSEIAEKFGLNIPPPDITDPEVVLRINAEVLEECMEDLEAAERGAAASRAAAWEIWVVN